VITLNELTDGGTRRLEVNADDVEVVSNRPMRFGSEIRTIDGRVFHVAEDVAEIFGKLEESDGDEGDGLA
jgi:hypothetical protein